MTSLKGLLTTYLADAFAACGFERSFGEVFISHRPDLGQFQCNGALTAAGKQKKNPLAIAQSVVAALDGHEILADITIAGPGFINLTLADQFLAAHTQQLANDDRLGCPPTANPQNVIIDFGGPNVAKPMHVGHLRSAMIGDSLQRLYRFAGDYVVSDIHLGDWGTQMGMLIAEIKRRWPDLPYFNPAYTGPYPTESPVNIADLQEIYPIASARCRQDQIVMAEALAATVELQQGRPGYRALWQHLKNVSLQELHDDYRSLGVSFDLWLGESDYHPRIPQMIEQLQANGQTQRSDGALVIPLTDGTNQREIPPLILLKADGGILYGTTDLATIDQRINDFHADKILYVVDARQSLHFEQVFQAARQTGLAPGVELEHVAFGTVNGPDGKPFKTRAGGVMRLKDLLAVVNEAALQRMAESDIAKDYADSAREDIAKKIGLAALKFADLMNHRASDYLFDLDKFTRFEGKTGPYLLYTVTRIKSVLRNAQAMALAPGAVLPPSGPERELMLAFGQLPDAVQSAYLYCAPNHLCDFAFNLAQAFNRFYSHCHILSEENPARQASWLTLAHLSLAELELSLALLGIETIDRM
jgi:arginyl-tRNA synthetase